jgi:hypothetical protein
MKKSIKQLQLEFLEEMVEYYSADPKKRRNYNETIEACQYHPASEESEGCAIGRKVSKRLAKKLDNFIGLGDDDGTSVKCNGIFKLLPQKLQRLGKRFLIDIQDFHDEKDYWADKETFEYQMDWIIGKYDLKNWKQAWAIKRRYQRGNQEA